ncbi:MAG: hypothetical protein DMD91_08005 [Candidatus Rokuibacteriota bacterium]|nr:MAG: hypothetical protein DMD91_08005 [Candidatus Rokubacteria bacterium]
MASSSVWTAGRLIVLGVFALYVVELSPHLVHHLFEHDDAQVDCQFAAAGDRQHAAPVPVVALTVAPITPTAVARVAEPDPIEPRSASIDARAPPLPA